MKELYEEFSWDAFDKFEETIDKYMPVQGEGDTKASQAVTAVNKLIYKWWNDGDVFDNTYNLEGWANDLSTYANWLYRYAPEAAPILMRIKSCKTEDDYSELLYALADAVLDETVLEKLNNEESEGSIYEENGPFKFEFKDEEDDEDDYWDEEEEEDNYEDEE